MLPNANSSHFCDVFFRHRAVLPSRPEKLVSKIKDRRQTIDRIPIDRHFLDLSETCLYMVHFGLGPFFLNSQKHIYIGLQYKCEPKQGKTL